MLPENLRVPSPNGVPTPVQLKVYEDFSIKKPTLSSSSLSTPTAPSQQTAPTSSPSPFPSAPSSDSETSLHSTLSASPHHSPASSSASPHSSPGLPSQEFFDLSGENSQMKSQYLDRLYALLAKLDQKVHAFIENSLSSSPSSLSLSSVSGDNDMFTVMNQIKASLQGSQIPPEVFGSFAIKIYQSLSEAKETLSTDVLLSLLVSVHRMSSVAVSRVITDSFLNDLMAEKALTERIVFDLISEGILITHEVIVNFFDLA